MSSTHQRFTATGKPRTGAGRHPYCKISFWTDPKNHFWEQLHRVASYDFSRDPAVMRIPARGHSLYTEAGKEYFRDKVARMVNDPHNALKIQTQ